MHQNGRQFEDDAGSPVCHEDGIGGINLVGDVDLTVFPSGLGLLVFLKSLNWTGIFSLSLADTQMLAIGELN